MEAVKIIKKYLFLLLFAVQASVAAAHPFYVSICQVDFNRESQSLEISVKIFADDLLLGLENAGAAKIYLGEARENPKTDEYIFNYLRSKLAFTVNGKAAGYTFVGKEMESDVVWTYLEIGNIQELNTVGVDCSILTEVLATQSNIIQVNNGETIKNLLLDKRKTHGTVSF